MTIIAARRYVSGKPDRELAIDGAPRGPLAEGVFDWVGLAEPDRQELDLVKRQFELHPLAVEDAMTPGQVAKLDIYGQQIFIVARTAAFVEGERLDYGQTAIFIGRDFVVSVRLGSARAHTALRARLEANDEHLAQGPDYVAHAVLDFIVDGYGPIMDRIEEAVQDMEERTIAAFPDQSTIRRIFRLRRQLRRFDAIVAPMLGVCDKLVEEELPPIDPATRVWFRDVADHVRRTLSRLRGLQDTLANIVETASLLEQHRQGEMTRKLAAWAAILAVPTAIAGIYGMNFDFMPELEWRYGYFLVLGTIAAICGGLWLRFRRIGWL
ncbi:MAG: magnesium and cobalt transport protein CorA [Novosphingobium sp.]|nr:magnesium and cobalt transport protein CorA [Novosphingobium sp.]